jgi:hypothetical protein
MMATRRINAATTWLIRAFAPGCPTMLRSWSAKRVDDRDHLTILYDLPDDAAFQRALELERSAGALRCIRIGKHVVAELTAGVIGAHRTLKIDAVLEKGEWQ